MHLEVGDRLLVAARTGGSGSHIVKVLSARGPDGRPPYLVLRYDNGHEELLDPTGDVTIRVLADTDV